MTFIKKVEDFNCEHCGALVKGNGYTNHCPECLWSKHVDVYPGDRSATCGGLMKPIAFEQEKTETIITHECIVCKYRKRNKVSIKDNVDTMATIAREIASKK